MSVKEQVLQAIQRLPDDIDYRVIADEIALLAAVHAAGDDSARGRPASDEQIKARQPRPFGLCAGEFVTPDDFDDPLPTDILRDFEGA